MWGKIIIPMYRLWLNGLYGLYGPRCPLSSKRPINLISLSLYRTLLIDMKRCESTECWTHVVTFSFDLIHDLDLEFSTSNFEIAVSQEWEGQLTWNKSPGTKGKRVDRVLYLHCDLELWPWPWIFKVKFWKCFSGMGEPIDMEPKGCKWIGC